MKQAEKQSRYAEKLARIEVASQQLQMAKSALYKEARAEHISREAIRAEAALLLADKTPLEPYGSLETGRVGNATRVGRWLRHLTSDSSSAHARLREGVTRP